MFRLDVDAAHLEQKKIIITIVKNIPRGIQQTVLCNFLKMITYTFILQTQYYKNDITI